MDSTFLVDALRNQVMQAAVDDTIAKLKSPPGRRVDATERALSAWYNALPSADVAFVNSIIASTAHEVLFGVLAVLDGAGTVDDAGGRFELSYVDRGRVLLNDPDSIGLHDLLNAHKSRMPPA